MRYAAQIKENKQSEFSPILKHGKVDKKVDDFYSLKISGSWKGCFWGCE